MQCVCYFKSDHYKRVPYCNVSCTCLQGIDPAVIFCGDLNSYPESGLHVFLTQKQISEKNADWYIGMES